MQARRREGPQWMPQPLADPRSVVIARAVLKGRAGIRGCAVLVVGAVLFVSSGCAGMDGRSETVESYGADAADARAGEDEQDDGQDRSGAPVSAATMSAPTTSTTTTVRRSTSLANSADTALAAAATEPNAPGGAAPGTPVAGGPLEAPVEATSPAAPPPPSPPPSPSAGVQDAAVARAVAGLSSDHARRVAAAALRLVRYDWAGRLPGWSLHFADGRSGYRGLTFIDRRAIEVYVRPSDTPEMVAHIVAHEIGHAVDLTYLNDTGRAAWLAARALPASTVWYPSMSGGPDFGFGAGDFAESFAWMFASQAIWAGRLAPPPTFAQGLAMAVLIGGA